MAEESKKEAFNPFQFENTPKKRAMTMMDSPQLQQDLIDKGRSDLRFEAELQQRTELI
jgi:hypothetical protein